MQPIPENDAKALQYAGALGHEFLVVHTYEKSCRVGVDISVSAEVNSLASAKRLSQPMDRIYQRRPSSSNDLRKWRLVHTMPAPAATPAATPVTAYVRSNDMRGPDTPAQYNHMYYYASQSPQPLNASNSRGGPYFHKDGVWRYIGLADGHWISKSVLITALKQTGCTIIDESGVDNDIGEHDSNASA